MIPSRYLLAPGPAETRARLRRRPCTILSCESLESRQLLTTVATTPVAQNLLQIVPMASGGFTTYTPQQIDSAYGIGNIAFSSSSGRSPIAGTGAGQTIAIVDAYSDPKIQSDLAAFDAKYGLGAPPSFSVDNLGSTTTNAGWALETALDVEWAHAIAPQASIVVVEASSASLGSLMSAVTAAAKLPGVSVVSMSWGSSEFLGEASYAGVFNTPAGHTNVSFIAASGDSGAWSGPMFPSVLPNVLAVGGTTLTLTSGATPRSETGWTDSTGGFSGLDNGFQSVISVPSYQGSTLSSVGLNYGIRTTPDVSFNADPNTGYAVYDSVSYNGYAGWFDVGGTSAAAPAWAGLVAITDQGLAASGKSSLTTSQLLTDLYNLPSSSFNVITSGFNGYSATAGYDLVTGLGTPRANQIVSGILAAGGVKATAGTQAVASTTVKQASSSATVHSAAVGASQSTATTSPAAVAASPFVGTSAGLAALPSSFPASTVASASPSQGPQSAPSVVSSNVAATAPTGFGQALTDSSSVCGSSSPRTTEDPAGTTTVVVDPGRDLDPPVPVAPMNPPSRAEDPMTEPSSGGETEGPIIPESIPTTPAPRVLPGPVHPLAAIPAARVDYRGNRDDEPAATDGPESGPGPMAGLVLAGAVFALGHRVVPGRTPRRRALAASFRAEVGSLA